MMDSHKKDVEVERWRISGKKLYVAINS